MKLRKNFLYAVAAITLCVSPAVFGEGPNQNDETKQAQLPPGNWSISAHPYLHKGYESILVLVYSVTSDIKEIFRITKVGLKNNSSAPVIAVKLRWLLFTAQEPGRILQQGQTPLIAISGGLALKEKRALDFPVISLEKIYKPLLKDGRLNGDFRIEVVVSEIIFEDGATWTGNQSR